MTVKPPKILTVDDDPQIRQSVAMWLGDAGYEVIEAENGREGLEALRAHAPDVVLLDLRMPVMDGLGFLNNLPAVSSDPPPVLIFSGKSDLSEVVESFKLGVLDFIPKPIESFDILEHAIENALERNALARKATLAERRYFNLVQNLPLMIYVLRRDFRLEFINKFCLDLLGFSRVEVFDDPDWLPGRLHPQDRERVMKILHDTFDRDISYTVECRLIHKDGRTIHGILKSMPSSLNVPGHEETFIEGILMDITDRVELEKFVVQEEKLKTLGVMTAELAHEIRNPLFSIAGFARRLQHKAPEFKETDIILSESARLEAMLKKVSDYLHPVQMSPKPCSINDAVRRAVEFLSAESVDRGAATALFLAPHPPKIVEDPDLLVQTVISLTGYALRKAKPPGPVVLRTHYDAHFIHLDVGFPMEAALTNPELMFLPFDEDEEYRGLPFAYRVIKNMGGALTFELERGQASFAISLPLQKNAEQSPDPDAS